MEKSLISIYKLPILITIASAIAFLAMTGANQVFDIAAIVGASFFGMFILDAEYFLNAYFLDSKSDFSKSLMAFIKHSDWANALKYIYYHKEESGENSLNSALFQIALAAMSIFVVYSTKSLFVKSLILSTFVHSIYVFYEYYFKGRTNEWFWALEKKPNKSGANIYGIILIVVLTFCLYNFQ